MLPPTDRLLIDRSTIDATHEHLLGASTEYVDLINEARENLGGFFDEDVAPVNQIGFRREVDLVFADPDLAVNVTALIYVCSSLDVIADHPGFIVDELLGRQLAIMIADGEPQATLAAATFHFMDIMYDTPEQAAGHDDTVAGVAAGFQTRLPGWAWQAASSPFDDE